MDTPYRGLIVVARKKMLTGVMHDMRFAIRSLRRTPGFTLVAILSLALGIGANTALFCLIDAIMLKSLPVSHPEELIQVTLGSEQYFSNPIWEQLRDRQDVFSGIFTYGRWSFNLAPSGEVRRVQGQFVSGQYFATLGIQPLLGRTFTPADDRRGCPGAAVLSYGFWQREYAGRRDILGETVSLDSHPFEIVGVMPRGFAGVEVGAPADVLAPLCTEKILNGEESILDKNLIPGWLQVIGRIKAGASSNQVNARLKVLASEVFRASLPKNWQQKDRDAYLKRTFDTQPAPNGLSYLRRQYRLSLMILMAITGTVLLIACANLTNLLLARGAARKRELATRIALGSGHWRLMRQLATESLMLSLAGTASGILVAYSAIRLLLRFLNLGPVPQLAAQVSLDLTPDLRVLTFTVAIAVASGLLFGLAPAWRCTRLQPIQAMKATPRGFAGRSRFGLGKAFVVLQMGLSVVLVVGAALLVSSLSRINSQDQGLEPEPVLVLTADLSNGNYAPELRAARFREMLEKLRTLPGVHSASLSNIIPLCGCRGVVDVVIDTYTPRLAADSTVLFNKVSGQYFETLGTPMMSGRDFNTLDTPHSAKVAIVNESMARKYFGALSPLGRQIRIWEGARIGDPYEIVGVVKDAKYGSLREQMSPTLYFTRNQDQRAGSTAYFEIRAASGEPESLIGAVKSAMDRNASFQVTPLAARITKSLSRERLLGVLSTVFGSLALMLAMMGLYGVMSYIVTLRRKDIAIRMALGSNRAQLFRKIMADVTVLIGAGLAVGLVLAMMTTRVLAALLYELKPTDPGTLAIAAMLLAGTGLLAGYLPARRASEMDPILALRDE